MAVGSDVIYLAWVSGVNSIAIRVCNINPNINLKNLGSGAIRVDIWKH
jgi:hypothetical protein